MPRLRFGSIADLDRVTRTISREFRSARIPPWDRADFLKLLLRDVPAAYGEQHTVDAAEAASNVVVADWGAHPARPFGRRGRWWESGFEKSYTLAVTPPTGWLFQPDHFQVVWQNPVGTSAVKLLTAVLADAVNVPGAGVPLLSAQHVTLARSENVALEHIYRRQGGGFKFDAVNDLEFGPLSELWMPPQSTLRMVSTDMIATDVLTWTMVGRWRFFAQFAEVPPE